jgi:hypothetical protein
MEAKLEAKDLLQILFERSNATTTLWNMEIAVVLGLIAFLGTAGDMTGHWLTKVAFNNWIRSHGVLEWESSRQGVAAKTGVGRFHSQVRIPGLCECIKMAD